MSINVSTNCDTDDIEEDLKECDISEQLNSSDWGVHLYAFSI